LTKALAIPISLDEGLHHFGVDIVAGASDRDVASKKRAELNRLIRSARLILECAGCDGAWDYLPGAIHGGVALRWPPRFKNYCLS
jgi:hypothetical protein